MLSCQEPAETRGGSQDVLIGPTALGRTVLGFQHGQHLRAKTSRRFKGCGVAARQQLGAQQTHGDHRQHSNQRFQTIRSFQLTGLDSGSAFERIVIFFNPPARRIAAHDAPHLVLGGVS